MPPKASSVLLLLLLAPLILCQFSYVPTSFFQAYQISTVESTPGTGLLTSLFDFNLDEPHHTINHHAIAYSGHSTVSNSMNLSFAIAVSSNTSTSYRFQLTILDTSVIKQLRFGLILIGNDGAGLIEVVTLTQPMSITAGSTATQIKSPFYPYTTAIPAPYTERPLLSSFTVRQMMPAQNLFNIGYITQAKAGQTVYAQFYTSYGNRITLVTYIWFIYTNSVSTIRSQRKYYNYATSYRIGTTSVQVVAGSRNVYRGGYNRKCLISIARILLRRDRQYLFDINYQSPNINQSTLNSQVSTVYISFICFATYFNCSIIDPNCIQCTSFTQCSRCGTQHYPRNNSCIACNTAFSCCNNCSDSSVCLGCDAPYILANGSCWVQHCISHSIDNTTHISCTQCTSQYGVVGGVCELCRVIIFGCQFCTSSGGSVQCTQCTQGYSLVTGGCTNIVGCVSLFPNSQTCLACNFALYNPTPIDNACVCLEGVMVNGICSTITGCISPIVGSTQVQCLFCNVTRNFNPQPNGMECQCWPHYQIVEQKCAQICGDGLLLGQLQCDDGNTIDGDGCSSTCKVQVQYRCSNGSSTSPSICTYVGIPLELTLTKIKRNDQLNQGIFYFKVYPPLLNIKRMNLSTYTQLLCDATYSISSVEYDTSGTLVMRADYSTDLQGLPCNMTLSFDSNIIRSQNVTVSFDAVSSTLPLVIIENQEMLRTIRTIFQIISYIGSALFILSLGHKMIGAELITNLQIVCLSNAFYDKIYFFFNEVRRLQLVTGYWSLYHEENDSDLIQPFSSRIDMAPFFLENSMLIVSVLIPATIIFVVLKAYHHYKTQEITQTQVVDDNTKPLQMHFTVRYLYRMLIFPISAGFLMIIMISSYVYCLRLTQIRQPSFPQILSVLVMLLIWLILSNICSAEMFNISPQLTGFKDAKCWYIPLFIVRSLFLAVMANLGITQQYDILLYGIILLQSIYLLVLIFIRAYKRVIDNVGVIITEVTTLYALTLPYALRFVSVNELYEIFMVFVLQGMILISLALSLTRIIVYYTKIIKAYLYPQQKMEPIPNANKKAKQKNILKIQEQQVKQMMIYNPYSVYNQTNRGRLESIAVNRGPSKIRRKVNVGVNEDRIIKQGQNEDEDSQLAATKQRLREDLLRKRQKDAENLQF